MKIGDRVQVLDDTISGIVHEIYKHSVKIKTSDGFVLDFDRDELVLDTSTINSRSIFSSENPEDIIAAKEKKSRKKQPKIKTKERNLPSMEVDLHINQLVKSSRGMSNFDMLNKQLNTAKSQLEFAIKKRIQKIVFIHGVGEGVLKEELETLFRRYENITFYDADYKKYGLGATEVYIYQNA